MKTAKINRVGETAVASNGMLMTIIAYRNTNDIDIQFEDGTILYHKQYNKFSRGQIRYESFKDKCKKANISYNNAITYRRNHPELTEEEVIQYYLAKEQSFIDKCKKANINYENANQFKHRHPELTDEQVIQYYLTQKEESFSQKCKKANVNYNTARVYKNSHPELTDEQVIIYYRPDLYINIFGELVGI